MAMMIIQLVHKIVREIPHALQQGIGSGLATIASACLLAAGMMLAGRGFRLGLLAGDHRRDLDALSADSGARNSRPTRR
jgi:hypothetical protein